MLTLNHNTLECSCGDTNIKMNRDGYYKYMICVKFGCGNGHNVWKTNNDSKVPYIYSFAQKPHKLIFNGSPIIENRISHEYHTKDTIHEPRALEIYNELERLLKEKHGKI